MSLESLLEERAGDGDVARNNIRSAASLSVGAGLGVVCWTGVLEPDGGVIDLKEGPADDEAVALVTGLFPCIALLELCAYCAYDCADASDVPSILDRGDDALPAIDGRWLSMNDVSVAAAFMSTSPSASTAERFLSGRLPLRLSGLPGFLTVLVFACARVPSAMLLTTLALPDRGDGAGLIGAGTGGSLAFRMVRACFAGGGARMEVNKL